MNVSVMKESRKMENIIYLVFFTVIALMPLIGEVFISFSGGTFHMHAVLRWWVGFIPYLLVFILHNFIIIPHYLHGQSIWKYLLSVLLLIILFFVFEYYTFETYRSLGDFGADYPKSHHAGPPLDSPGRRIGIPLPVVMDTVILVSMIGLNVATALLFKSHSDNQSRKQLENLMLQDELKYLKAQINPHFFMNMLNNIHAMVELNPGKAQEMIMELSKLMRYVLYEGEGDMTTLANETRFLSSYLALMRQRYSSEKVRIETDLPAEPSCETKLPPLLFIAFVENAFKHGISYRHQSSVSVSLEEKGGRILFSCRNTKNYNQPPHESGGVGLDNVRRRLRLIYGVDAILEIKDGKEEYVVYLNIPCR